MFHFTLFDFSGSTVHLFIDVECSDEGFEEGRVILNTYDTNSVVYVNYVGQKEKREAIALALQEAAKSLQY